MARLFTPSESKYYLMALDAGTELLPAPGLGQVMARPAHSHKATNFSKSVDARLSLRRMAREELVFSRSKHRTSGICR